MGEIESNHFIGIDGGGTGCRVAIADATGAIVAQSVGGPANFATNPSQAVLHVTQALGLAAASANLAQDYLHICPTHIGLAGVLDDLDAANLGAALPFTRLRVSDDRQTSMSGALGVNDGILAAIGTGSFVGARQGPVVKYFGGWGLMLGDQASGAWLGRSALELCLLVHDGLENPSDLTRSIFARIGKAPASFVAFGRQALPKDFAAFAPFVIEGAGAGDHNAVLLMQRGAHYLNRCFWAAGVAKDAVVCLSGGVGPHYAPYLAPEFANRVSAPKGTALDGALQLARQRQIDEVTN
jgi:glucosamine kinase